MQFYIVDVFGEEKYSGNQLAVVVANDGVSDNTMLKIAREFHFSETTFILGNGSGSNEFDVRIFTPNNEVPFAGHPTLGTAFVINKELLKNPVEKIILNLKVGKIPVVFENNDVIWMNQIEPVFGETHNPIDFSKILNIAPNEIDDKHPIQNVSTGLDFILIPLKSLKSIKAASTNQGYYKNYFQNKEAKPLFLFCNETYRKENDINCRMFADIFGIPEDPATGSANGCLAGYLIRHNYFNKEAIDIKVEQGFEIGRKSILHVKAIKEKKCIKIRVGGKVFEIAKGNLL